jgi:hypothetical protein
MFFDFCVQQRQILCERLCVYYFSVEDLIFCLSIKYCRPPAHQILSAGIVNVLTYVFVTYFVAVGISWGSFSLLLHL